ncbi:hypothetical protein EZJ19_05140 [Parasulfuritortus cantonensis]|uniref:Nitrogen fixation protein FixH n=2 Tax=Parasulfuritortus cantonensis TaxID=2528202 RepID=A0A4R1BGG7_9PROT|nr:hypothetical protein EZJ19_05140 [Parasulfuritortus cantonensis]
MNTTMLEKKTVWWSEPMVWLLITLPLTAVIAGTLTVWIAVKNADTLVKEEHVKDGMGIAKVADRDIKAAQLGVVATLQAEPGRLVLKLSGHFAKPQSGLTLTLVHPTDERQDMVLLFSPAGPDSYATAYASLPAGKRLLELAPGDRSWRLAGQWQAPFTGTLQLAAASQFSSTQHSPNQP